MNYKKLLVVVGLALTVVVGAGTLEAQHDPGPRGGILQSPSETHRTKVGEAETDDDPTPDRF